ncbi:MAG: hypothetical protein JWQ49_1474 [Edaphobacter sp.]|nr:hypothetical protein [Edaphobacter sp.]
MNNVSQEVAESIVDALLAGRPVRSYGPYEVLIGDDTLRFEARVIADPVPTGAQILETAGVKAPTDYVAYRVLKSGLLEELRPDETTDLRESGVERFIIFRTDRIFRFLLNDRSFEWGAPHITGLTLKKLASVDPTGNEVWLDVPRGVSRLIGDMEFADLAAPGVERFYTRATVYKIIVNTRPKEVFTPKLTFWEVVKLAFPDASPSQTKIYTVTYKRGPSSNPEGSMVDGETVHLKDGMLFNVTPTDKS